MSSRQRERELRLHSRLLAGDEEALGEAYDAFAPLVYGLALRATGDQASAEDLTERVFLRLWEHPAEFHPERGPLQVLLAGLTRRWGTAGARKAGAHRAVLHGLGESTAVRQALLSLPVQQRDAIMLAYFHGFDHHQVAAELGIAEGTARTALHQGLDRLADAVASGAPARAARTD